MVLAGNRSGHNRWLLALLVVHAAGTVSAAAAGDDVHVVFLTDCTSYSDWQTLGMVFSWKESGQVSC